METRFPWFATHYPDINTCTSSKRTKARNQQRGSGGGNLRKRAEHTLIFPEFLAVETVEPILEFVRITKFVRQSYFPPFWIELQCTSVEDKLHLSNRGIERFTISNHYCSMRKVDLPNCRTDLPMEIWWSESKIVARKRPVYAELYSYKMDVIL